MVVGNSPLMVETGERCEGVGEVIDEKEQPASDDDYGSSPPPMGDNSPRGAAPWSLDLVVVWRSLLSSWWFQRERQIRSFLWWLQKVVFPINI
jgi:hypothetical protein